jgi:hypothetical protein
MRLAFQSFLTAHHLPPDSVRDAVFVKSWTTEQAARDAQNRRAALPAGATEDASALHDFAADMRPEPFRH